MADSRKTKRNKGGKRLAGDTAAAIVILAVIAVYVLAECYSALHVEVETITAVTSTVYDSIEAKALIIRDERTVTANNNSVTVYAAENGEKVKLGGTVAMEFASDAEAKNYTTLQSLKSELDYYNELESKSAGVATDVETVDRDIIGNVNEYVRAANYGSVSGLSGCADELNDKLTRRQMIIGESVDFTAVKEGLQSQINEINTDECSPTGYIRAEESGIFSSYTDGLEGSFDYDAAQQLDAATLKSYMDQAQQAKAQGDNVLGKLITSYEWYFCAVVSADAVKDINNGDSLDVAVKDSEDVIKCLVVSGADAQPWQEETALVLRCSRIDSEIASMRLEDIEIRYNSYTGFKVPVSAVHIDDEGGAYVYALVANQVKQRSGEIVYSTKDYSIFEYDPENSDSIRFYDQIITKGKDLHDGKVYT